MDSLTHSAEDSNTLSKVHANASYELERARRLLMPLESKEGWFSGHLSPSAVYVFIFS